MVSCLRRWLLPVFLLCSLRAGWAADARFDLVGPKIDVRVTRGTETLPIASVPNLQPGDKLWLHPDLPATQSVKYLLICAFLRGTTNPPPDNWFNRIETWNKKVRDEGVFVTVPDNAEEAILFMAPETGGDFSTLKSAVRGRPGVFVRASQDLNEAGFEQARIERYLADIRRVPPADAADLQRRSDLLARTLALKPNADCFKRPADVQFTCLTQSGSQLLLDDGHGQTLVNALSSGPSSDFISAASYTQLAGAGIYSAYVGAIVDLARLMGSLHTAQYQYIPAIAFPQGDALNLRLNTPPSFHNPKSVLVIGLPGVQAAQKPPLRPADAAQVACLLKPKVVLPIEGAPLVFSTDFATEIVLHLNTPPGAPAERDIPLVADAYEGGLVLQQSPEHHVPLHDSRPILGAPPAVVPDRDAKAAAAAKPQPEPVMLTGTILGHWGFDEFIGPTVRLQQLPGSDWRLVGQDGGNSEVIAGKTVQIFMASTGSACVHTVSALPAGTQDALPLTFNVQPRPGNPEVLAVNLPGDREIRPGSLRLEIQQFGQPKPDGLAAQTFADPAHVGDVMLPAGSASLLLIGTNLDSVDRLVVGDLVFRPETDAAAGNSDDTAPPANSVRMHLAPNAPRPPTKAGDHLLAQVVLNDGRHLPISFTVLPSRPSVVVLSRTFDPLPGTPVVLTSPDDLPLASHLSFTLKSRVDFPRSGRVEVETADGTLRSVLTLAPSGGLVLQDPHTVVASLDPLRSFGPNAFGPLRLRVVFPPPAGKAKRADTPDPTGNGTAFTTADTTAAGQPASPLLPEPENPSMVGDWIPMGTLVRVPTLAHLQCPVDPGVPCTLTGSNLFLLQAVSADPAFANPDPVPDGFTGTALPVPHPATSAGVLFFKLRDDPTPIDSASLATTTVTTQANVTHTHPAVHN